MKARGLKGTKCPRFVGAVNLKYETGTSRWCKMLPFLDLI